MQLLPMFQLLHRTHPQAVPVMLSAATRRTFSVSRAAGGSLTSAAVTLTARHCGATVRPRAAACGCGLLLGVTTTTAFGWHSGTHAAAMTAMCAASSTSRMHHLDAALQDSGRAEQLAEDEKMYQSARHLHRSTPVCLQH